MKPKLIILLDAFGEEYYNKSSYLKELGTEKCSIEALFGYQPVDDAFLSGRYPSESNVWFSFIVRERGMYGGTKHLLPVIKIIKEISPGVVNSGIPFAYSRLAGVTNLYKIPPNLPLEFLYKVELSLKHHPSNKKYFNHTIFSLLREKKIQYKFIISNIVFHENGYNISYSKKGSDETARDLFIHHLDKNIRFYFVHLTELDKNGHKYYQGSQIDNVIEKEEGIIKEIVDEFLCLFPDGEFIVFGDHGMAPVKNHVDPYTIIENVKEIARDFSFFIDSTFLRMFFKYDDEIDKATELVKNNFNDVVVIDDNISNKFKVPTDKKYGDLIISVKPYSLFYPNFFDKDFTKGMHGYTPDIPEAPGCLITNIEIGKKSLKIPELYNIMKKTI